MASIIKNAKDFEFAWRLAIRPKINPINHFFISALPIVDCIPAFISKEFRSGNGVCG